jgi:hypothetical protein
MFKKTTFRSVYLDRAVQYFVKICGFAICGLIMKICDSEICGLAQLRHMRISDSGMSSRI